MPTFDFSCEKCSHVFEISRPFGKKVHPVCPSCGNKKTKKLISPPLIHFKGSGFYKTDSVAKPVTKKPKKEETKTEVKTEAKPETKAATEKKGNAV
ncbi:MAG: zinc ribbon domain-containing protein [Candidatus Peribacteraceae bacterium]